MPFVIPNAARPGAFPTVFGIPNAD